ncbi:DUF3862 domain-containing protein [Streptococcus catagoni]|uniref:DUF3862 domain-containing protein n=1 Tax=Streptococcus catagoni TaxID=2654874 RepID=UPI00140CCCAB|nr:DUF3862 domain-containing protein [Streptococcus catagoni]
MKFKKCIQLITIASLCLLITACAGKTDKKTKSKNLDDSSLSLHKTAEAEHQDKRFAFEKIKVAKVEQEFKGGTSLEELKELFGQPTSHEQKPAGNVKLDNYTWHFDHVVIKANLFENSTIVKSISNFAFSRKMKISLKDYNKLEKGMSYNQVVKILTEPDDYTEASSSDNVQLQAIWISGIKTRVQGANINLIFKNDKLVELSQKGLIK